MNSANNCSTSHCADTGKVFSVQISHCCPERVGHVLGIDVLSSGSSIVYGNNSKSFHSIISSF